MKENKKKDLHRGVTTLAVLILLFAAVRFCNVQHSGQQEQVTLYLRTVGQARIVSVEGAVDSVRQLVHRWWRHPALPGVKSCAPAGTSPASLAVHNGVLLIRVAGNLSTEQLKRLQWDWDAQSRLTGRFERAVVLAEGHSNKMPCSKLSAICPVRAGGRGSTSNRTL